MSEMRWALIIKQTDDGPRYAAWFRGELVSGWFSDFWRLYAKMSKAQP